MVKAANSNELAVIYYEVWNGWRLLFFSPFYQYVAGIGWRLRKKNPFIKIYKKEQRTNQKSVR